MGTSGDHNILWFELVANCDQFLLARIFMTL
jgi:hypothetical protein